MSLLNSLKPNKGAKRAKIRIGRGIGSGKGKTGGRGGKGQTARSGSAINGFEGGQMPIHRRIPKRGFNNFTRKEFEVVNLSDLQQAIDSKKIKAGEISVQTLIDAGLVKGRLDGIKLLGNGEIKSKVEISVNKASSSAVKAIESAGGKVNLIVKAEKPAKEEDAKSKAKKAPKAKK
jgi:large subunit ribosomal protein L15